MTGVALVSSPSGRVVERPSMPLEYVDCNYCGSRNAAAYRSAKSHYGPELFQIVRCQDCGLVFVNPRPARKRDEIASRTVPGLHPSSAEIFHKTLGGKFILNKIARYRRQGTLLDFGCGQGFLVRVATLAGFDAYGVELNAALAQAANAYWKTDRILSWNLDRLTERFASAFDVINSSQVFEHLTDPLGTAQALAALLKDGGILALDVPNVRSLRYLLRGGAIFDPTAHLYHFSAETLSKLLARAGFEVLEAKTSLTMVGVMAKAVTDPGRAAGLAYRLYRLPTAGFGLNAVAIKRRR
jgi:SAM-dependent methyltransferase